MANEKPRLALNRTGLGNVVSEECSVCGRAFLPPKDRSPKAAVTKLWAEFKDHVRKDHPEHAESIVSFEKIHAGSTKNGHVAWTKGY